MLALLGIMIPICEGERNGPEISVLEVLHFQPLAFVKLALINSAKCLQFPDTLYHLQIQHISDEQRKNTV